MVFWTPPGGRRAPLTLSQWYSMIMIMTIYPNIGSKKGQKSTEKSNVVSIHERAPAAKFGE